LSDMVAVIDQDRRHGNLSSAIRLFVLDHFRSQRDPGRAETKAPAAAAGRSESVLRVD
jgi:predicted DNA-binding ribbon-helix-helix protein